MNSRPKMLMLSTFNYKYIISATGCPTMLKQKQTHHLQYTFIRFAASFPLALRALVHSAAANERTKISILADYENLEKSKKPKKRPYDPKPRLNRRSIQIDAKSQCCCFGVFSIICFSWLAANTLSQYTFFLHILYAFCSFASQFVLCPC